jgi:hypothetical protein
MVWSIADGTINMIIAQVIIWTSFVRWSPYTSELPMRLPVFNTGLTSIRSTKTTFCRLL